MTTKVEIGIMLLLAKEGQRLPVNHHELGRGKEQFPYRFQRECDSADNLI